MPNHLTRKVTTREAELRQALEQEAAKTVDAVAVKEAPTAEQRAKRPKLPWLNARR